MRYNTILFDLDHTLLDSDASQAIAFDMTMRSAGLDAGPSSFSTFDRLNQALWRAVERGELSPNDVKLRRFEQLVDVVGADADPGAMATAFVSGLAEHGELFAGAGDVLDELSRMCRLALVTNGIGSVQRRRLRRLGLEDRFEVVSISGELGISKPEAAIFEHTLNEMGIDDRSDIVMVGDSLVSDVRGGVNAGIDTLWFNPRGLDNATGIEPTHEVRSLDRIPALIRGAT